MKRLCVGEGEEEDYLFAIAQVQVLYTKQYLCIQFNFSAIARSTGNSKKEEGRRRRRKKKKKSILNKQVTALRSMSSYGDLRWGT